jgi:large subunit ribosomal protein L14e|uniref:Large ribosomal subunit protein eL14 n=2 Tax=Panagrolaimus TaxID=55784 RepID=A0A914PEF5_9BILA
MIFTKFVEIGRVVYISKGKNEGKLAVITNVVDGNKVLVDGPSTGVPRSVRNFKDLQLTKFKVPVRVGQRTGGVKKAFDEAGIISKWNESSWAKGIQKRTLRAGLNDFERFKVLRVKQLRNRIIRAEAGKLRKAAKKA